jgi:hypothetical protein
MKVAVVKGVFLTMKYDIDHLRTKGVCIREYELHQHFVLVKHIGTRCFVLSCRQYRRYVAQQTRNSD